MTVISPVTALSSGPRNWRRPDTAATIPRMSEHTFAARLVRSNSSVLENSHLASRPPTSMLSRVCTPRVNFPKLLKVFSAEVADDGQNQSPAAHKLRRCSRWKAHSEIPQGVTSLDKFMQNSASAIAHWQK